MDDIRASHLKSPQQQIDMKGLFNQINIPLDIEAFYRYMNVCIFPCLQTDISFPGWRLLASSYSSSSAFIVVQKKRIDAHSCWLTWDMIHET